MKTCGIGRHGPVGTSPPFCLKGGTRTTAFSASIPSYRVSSEGRFCIQAEFCGCRAPERRIRMGCRGGGSRLQKRAMAVAIRKTGTLITLCPPTGLSGHFTGCPPFPDTGHAASASAMPPAPRAFRDGRNCSRDQWRARPGAGTCPRPQCTWDPEDGSGPS